MEQQKLIETWKTDYRSKHGIPQGREVSDAELLEQMAIDALKQSRNPAVGDSLQTNGLLPCPFCGGKGVAHQYGNGLTISCNKCFLGTMLYPPQEAIKKWNNRAMTDNE